MVTTTHGEMDERLLRKVEALDEHDEVVAVSYYLEGELVHRSTVVRLAGVQATGAAKDLTQP